jgi:hypothetical protein
MANQLIFITTDPKDIEVSKFPVIPTDFSTEFLEFSGDFNEHEAHHQVN